MASKKATTRRKVQARGLVVSVLPEGKDLGIRGQYLSKLTTKELIALSRAAGVGIAKKKEAMVERLAESPLVTIAVQVEAVVFDRPATPKA